MAIETKCGCGRVLKAPEFAIGKRGRCGVCGQGFEIVAPPADELDDIGISMPVGAIEEGLDELDDVDLEAMVRSALSPQPSPPLSAVPAASQSIPPEPFCYAFLVFYAMSCVAIGIGQFLWVLLGAASQIASTADGDTSMGPFTTGVVLVSLAWMLGIILVSCPILLAVDAARNIRAMRYRTQP